MTETPTETSIETLSRERFEKQLSQGSITLFRYTPNSRGFTFLQICAAILISISVLTYADTRFEPLYWGLLAGLLSVLGLGLLGIVIYWTLFTKWSAVAFDDEHLYIVGRKAAERIAWRSVSLESVGFKEADKQQHPGVFHMRIHQRDVTLRLFNSYVWIDDFPSLLAELLDQIKHNQSEQAPPSEDA